jgi:hypothetical protein
MHPNFSQHVLPKQFQVGDSLSRKEILTDFPKDWSVWSPATLREKKGEVLIAPSHRTGAGHSKEPTKTEGR